MHTVLLCDDDLMNRKVASKILYKEGFNVVEAANGKEAINYLSQQSVSLILMDLMMPVMNGFETITHIKANPTLSHTPIIVISALSDTDSITKALTLGADAYVTKPYNINAFCQCIHHTLKESCSYHV